jgi:hypothetical protein
MNNNFLLDNNLTDYGMLILCGLILTCSVCYLIRSNYTAIPPKNMEPFTYEEMEAVFNEHAVTVMNSENLEDIIDSDSDTDVEFDYQSTYNSDSTSDIESILNDPERFFMPNVDFDVCPIEELKFFEFTSLYNREIVEHSITDADIIEFLSWFSKEELATNWINDVFLFVINLI